MTGVGMLATAGHADETPGSGFLSVSLSAVSGGQRVLADEFAGQPPGTFTTGIPHTEVQLTASGGHALSSAVWPGALVGNVGTLLGLLGPYPCTPGTPAVPAQCSPVAVPQQVIDEYPLLNSPVRAEAHYPTHQYASNSVPGVTMTARAEANEVSADAVVGAAYGSSVESFGTLHTTSSVALTGPTTGIADARSSVTDVDLDGGLVTIGSVASEAHGSTDGQLAHSTGATTVQDLKVAGIPVSVDDKGVHVASATVPVDPATALVNQVLGAFGFKIYLTKPTTKNKRGTATYDAGSLIIVWDPNGKGTQDLFIVFGGATIQASATLPFELAGTEGESAAFGAGGGPGSAYAPSSGGYGPALGATEGATGSLPAAGPGATLAAPTLATAKFRTGVNPGWVVLALLGVALFALGLGRLPDPILNQVGAECVLGEEA